MVFCGIHKRGVRALRAKSGRGAVLLLRVAVVVSEVRRLPQHLRALYRIEPVGLAYLWPEVWG